MKIKFTIIFCLLLFVKTENAKSQDLLKGYKIFNIARKNVPLGAQWINGVGPDGSGTSQDNIRYTESVDYLTIDNSLKANITSSVLKYLGITGDITNKINIQCKNLKIYTVSDISKTNIRTGQYMVYEYIAADTISVIYDRTANATVEGSLTKNKIVIKQDVALGQKRQKSFSGRDLAFGYRIFQFGKSKVVEKKVKIKDTKGGGGLREVKILNYDISFNDYNLRKCLGGSVPIKQSDFLVCGRANPIEVGIRNYNNNDVLGKPLSKETSMSADTYKDIFFSYRSNNKLISDNIRITYSYQPPRMFLYMSDNSKVEIRTVETPLTMLENPFAAGW